MVLSFAFVRVAILQLGCALSPNGSLPCALPSPFTWHPTAVLSTGLARGERYYCRAMAMRISLSLSFISVPDTSTVTS
jgi:hypothetical protein